MHVLIIKALLSLLGAILGAVVGFLGPLGVASLCAGPTESGAYAALCFVTIPLGVLIGLYVGWTWPY